MVDDSPKLTISHAARVIGVSEATVRLMERRGELPATRTSTGIRLFDRNVVERVARERAERFRLESVERLARAGGVRGELEPLDAA